MTKQHVVIIGGGIIGSSIAYFLVRSGQAGPIAVIEPDSGYTLAATPNGAGGIRQLFSRPENIWMSQYSLQFYKGFAETMAIDGVAAEIDFNQRGYLFVVGEHGASQLEMNYTQQVEQGVQALLLDRLALAARFPSLGLTDIVLGCLSPDDGTLTTSLALQGIRRKAESLGVRYIESRVRALELHRNRVQFAQLEEGTTIQADVFVNAAGAWASEIAAMVNLSLPVVPMCRVKHYWTCQMGIA